MMIAVIFSLCFLFTLSVALRCSAPYPDAGSFCQQEANSAQLIPVPPSGSANGQLVGSFSGPLLVDPSDGVVYIGSSNFFSPSLNKFDPVSGLFTLISIPSSNGISNFPSPEIIAIAPPVNTSSSSRVYFTQIGQQTITFPSIAFFETSNPNLLQNIPLQFRNQSGYEGLSSPCLFALTFNPLDGMLYGVENNRISRIDPSSGVISVFAGSLTFQPGYQDAVGTNALFRLGSSTFPTYASQGAVTGFAIDRRGVIFVVDPGNDVIRQILPDGTVSTLTNANQVVPPSMLQPGFQLTSNCQNFIAIDSDGDLWFWNPSAGLWFVITTVSVGPNPAGTTTVVNQNFTILYSMNGLGMTIDARRQTIYVLGSSSTPTFQLVFQNSNIGTLSGLCAPGNWCPIGSSTPQGAGLCQAGYVCQGGASTPTGDGACSAGHFSKAGATTCSPCLNGFVSTGNGML
jgi:hypothetical protein